MGLDTMIPMVQKSLETDSRLERYCDLSVYGSFRDLFAIFRKVAKGFFVVTRVGRDLYIVVQKFRVLGVNI